MGFEQAGFSCLFQVEWDKHCQSVLKRHWPHVPKWGDVCDVNGAEIPPVDIIIFGSPCQDLSVAGKRSGLDGGRSSMFFEAIRIIKEMQNATGNTYPRIVVWENVPGALTSNRGADFQAVLDEMGNCGSLLTEWAVLDAQHFGVPQRRRRIFLVAVFDPATASRCPDPLFPVAPGRRGDYSKGIKEGQKVAGTLGGGSGSRGWSSDTDRMTFIPEVMLNFQGAKNSSITNQDDVSFTLNAMHGHDVHFVTTAVKTVRSGARDANGNLPPEVWKEIDLAPTLNSMDNTGESRATVLAFPIQGTIIGRSDTAGPQGPGYGKNGDPMFTLDTASQHGVAHITEPIIFENSYRDGIRLGDGISQTLSAKMGTGGLNTPIISQPAVRRLTPLECERLMGWPDNHTRWTAENKEQSDSARYKQCGNGVATPVARWIAQQLEPLL